MQSQKLQQLATLIRYFILTSTTTAGSGHPTSSLSATDLMTVLMFGGFFCADLKHPEYVNNDRLIFSKGHASPLLYALYAAAGVVSEKELMTLRKFGSPLEGHPTMAFPYTEAATGSLGQGLSVGVGMALNAKYLQKLPYRTFVLLGDSEMAEGSVWEAMASATHYKLDNLIGILDVNRLGQRGETMYGHHLDVYKKKAQAFGWETVVIDGHNVSAIEKAYQKALKIKGKPVLIIAKTLKGKGVSFIENKDGWHGRALSAEELQRAIQELGTVNLDIRGVIKKPKAQIQNPKSEILNKSKIQKSNTLYPIPYTLGEKVATRKAYGNALVRIYPKFPAIVALDGEVSNSTYAEIFKKVHPDRFFEMFIAEQNMVGVALGLSRRGNIPFVSSFAAFFTRAADQIRMCQYSDANIKFVGSHAGVSIGEDGASQMGLEEIAMFRAIHGSVVLYPSDAVSTDALVAAAAEHAGMAYIQTTRMETPVLYSPDEQFPIGGSKTVRESADDVVTVFAAGIAVHEAIEAHDALKKENIMIRVVDMYSIKPLDAGVIQKACKETKALIVVEDAYPEGALYEAVCGSGAVTRPTYSLAVRQMPKTGKPAELLAYEEIDAAAIVKKVKSIL